LIGLGLPRFEPDDAPWPGRDDRPGAGQENSGPVRAESGKNGGIGIDRRGNGGRITHVTYGFPQIRRIVDRDLARVARKRSNGVTALKCLPRKGEPGSA
jgi:hypothetical protein